MQPRRTAAIGAGRFFSVLPAFLLVLAAPWAARAGSVSGRVTGGGGAGVANVFVDLYDEAGEWFDWAATDSAGSYRIEDVGSGVFYLHTDTLGAFVDEWYDDVPGAADRVFFDPVAAGATAVTVPAVGTVTALDFSLATAGAIEGTVVDTTTASPITNIYVDAHTPDGVRFRSALTKTDGTYRIDGLPAGGYAIRTDTLGSHADEWHNGVAAFSEVSPDEAGIAALTVAAGQTVPGVRFELAPGAIIEGEARTGDGTPVASVFVDLYDLGGARLEFDRTDTNGVFRLAGLPAGVYYLGTDSLGGYIDLWHDQALMLHPYDPAADGADPVTVATNATVSGLQFVFDQGGEISGRVIDDGGVGVADAFVDVCLETGLFDYAVTGSDGSFRVGGLPDRTYYVKTDTLGARLDEWYEDHVLFDVCDPLGDGADPVPIVDSGSVSNLVMELGPGAAVSGSVAEMDGTPLAGVYVDLCDEDGARQFYTRTDALGEYRLGGLPAGTFYLRTDAADAGSLVDEWHADRPVLNPSEPTADGAMALTLAIGDEMSDIDFALALGASISGMVTGPGGEPVTGGGVEVFLGSVYYAYAPIATNGAYTVSGLPAGTWYLQTDAAAALVNEWYHDVYIFRAGLPVEDGATPVELDTAEAVTGIDFALDLGGDLGGTVRDGNGFPMEGVAIDLHDATGRFYDFTLTEANGRYLLEYLPPGTWYAATGTFGEYVDLWYDGVGWVTGDPIGDGATALAVEDGVAVTGVDFILLPPPPPVPVISALSRDGGSIRIEWDSTAGVSYQVERQPAPGPTGWEPAPTGVEPIEESLKPPAAADGTLEYRDPDPPPTARATYRIGAF